MNPGNPTQTLPACLPSLPLLSPLPFTSGVAPPLRFISALHLNFTCRHPKEMPAGDIHSLFAYYLHGCVRGRSDSLNPIWDLFLFSKSKVTWSVQALVFQRTEEHVLDVSKDFPAGLSSCRGLGFWGPGDGGGALGDGALWEREGTLEVHSWRHSSVFQTWCGRRGEWLTPSHLFILPSFLQ